MRHGPLAMLLLAAACGGGSNEAPMPAGAPAGVPFTPSAATAYVVQVGCSGGQPSRSVVDLEFASFPLGALLDQRVCGLQKASATRLTARVVRELAPGRALIGPGSYALAAAPDAGGTQASARVFRMDAACTDTGGQATSGTIVLDAVSRDLVNGFLDLTFPGGAFRGSFSLPVEQAALRMIDAACAPYAGCFASCTP